MTRDIFPKKRTCVMCGSPMVEVRHSYNTDDASFSKRQDWQCPRCLHVEHDLYLKEENA